MKLFKFGHKQLFCVVFLCAGLMLGATLAHADTALPSLGENGGLSLKQEEELGGGLYLKLQQQGYVVDDPLLSRYLQDIGESLLSSLEVRYRRYHFFLVKDSAVNAFAAPGGYVGVNTGLIAVADNVDELASVMAHEISHVRLKHTMQMIERAKKVNVASMVTILAAILVGGRNADAANAIIFTGIAGSEQSMINYTRENEYEADRMGIDLLKKSEYNPYAAADFMRVLQSREQQGGLASIEYLRTHPVSSNRIAEILARLQGVKKKASPGLRFQQFKDYLFYRYPQNSVRRRSRFARALSAMQNGHYARSEALLRELKKSDPDSLWVSYALAQNMEFQHRFLQAQKIYRNALLLYPDDLALSLKLAHLLLEQKKPAQALAVAAENFNKYKNDPAIYRLKVEIYQQLDKPTQKQLAEANYHWYSGHKKQAIRQFKALLESGRLDVATATEIKQKIEKK